MGIGDGIHQFHLGRNELAYIGWLQLADDDRLVCEFVQQQSPYGAQLVPTCANSQTTRMTHVGVVPTQLIGDRASRFYDLRDYALGPKHHQQVSQRGTQIPIDTHHWRYAATARQMIIEELPDGLLVDQVN